MQKIINFFIFKGAKIVKNNELTKHSSNQFDIFALSIQDEANRRISEAKKNINVNVRK